MTDPRYDGPDGAKRIELLERLAVRVTSARAANRRLWPMIEDVMGAIYRDNERVDRLEKEREDAAPSDGDDSRWRQ